VKRSSKYEPKEAFIKIQSQRDLHQNMKSKKDLSKYEAKESFVKIWSQVWSLHFPEKKLNHRWNMKSKCEAFIKIRTQRSFHQNMRPKRPSSKYEVKESFVKIWSQRSLHQNRKPKRPSSNYEVKESFVKIRRQRKLCQNTKSFVQPLFFREKPKPWLK
jgi:hypothetical protein